jgi:hypothetical protein
MAIGADRAILVETAVELQPLAVAKLLKAIAAKEAPQLIILGKQAIDDDANQTCFIHGCTRSSWSLSAFGHHARVVIPEEPSTRKRCQ